MVKDGIIPLIALIDAALPASCSIDSILKREFHFRAISEKSSLRSQKFLILNHAPTRFIDGYSISPEAPNDS